ncbi:MAG: patatin-like phospholipase family protein, partial [Rhodomicrobium sp.]|nr:patatin-like phospholipase family protein [Rhodomicrobium sp.]
MQPLRIGLALGGGGARGLAHIAILEAFDETGVKPAMISGTSIGALIGAAYASGMPAAEIRSYCEAAFAKRSALLRHIYYRWRGRVWDYWRPGAPAFFKSERIFELVLPPNLPETFESLEIPFQTVATGFFTQSECVIASGPLLPAIAASSALPALLTPVKLDGQILIDGGFVNPLPFDLLKPHTDFVLAVDVSGGPGEPKDSIPRPIETLLGAQQIALRSIINAKLKVSAPDVLIRP